MVAVPFFYFLILFLVLYSRVKEIDLACYTVLIYMVSAFFSILIDSYGLRGFDVQDYQISIWATFAYCSLLTLTLIPVAIYSNADIIIISPIKNEKLLKFIAWVAGIFFLFFLFMSFSSLVRVLTGDMGELRNDLYRGDVSIGWMGQMNPILRLPISLLNMIFGCPWILMLLAFFSVIVQKLPLKYGVLLFMGSLLGPLNSIIGIDRSGMAYWLISLGACFLVFAPFMEASQKRKVSMVLGVLVALVLLYLATVTESRFGESDGGSFSGPVASLISYWGQTFINFCYFFDNFEPPYPTLRLIFPFTSIFIQGGEFESTVALQQHLTLITGKELGVFYAFIGHLSTTAGKTVMVMYCIVIALVSLKVLRRKDSDICDIKHLLLYMFFSSIMFLGFFTHYYASANKTFSVVAFLIISHYLMKEPYINE